jgi:Family of unknown function (DUF5723)
MHFITGQRKKIEQTIHLYLILNPVRMNHCVLKTLVIVTFCLFSIIFKLEAQIELSNFTATGRAGISSTLATDYQAQGVNPANLALDPSFDGMHHTIGFGELGFSVYSDALSKLNLRTALFNPSKKLSTDEKSQAAQDFAGNGLTVNMDFLYGGYAWQRNSGGSGFAFTMRERAQWYSKFNPLAAEIMFKGFNANTYFDSLVTKVRFDSLKLKDTTEVIGAISKVPQFLSKILEGTRIAMSWNREYGFSYGVNVINNYDLKLDIGVGLKYIQGIGYLDIQSDGKTLKAFIASSPWFGIKFGNNGQLQQPSDSVNLGFLPNSAGMGIGFEFGATAIIREHFRVSASLTDLGSINYQTNVYSATDAPLTNISNRGFSSYNFFKNAGQFDGFQKDLIKWEGLKNRRQDLPTKMRIGFAMTYEKWNAGIETVIPLNNVSGNFVRPIYSIGGEYRVVEWMKLGSGFLTGGNYSNVMMPFGVTLVTSGGLWEMGIASRDVLTYIKQKKPMLSLSTGLLRFRF